MFLTNLSLKRPVLITVVILIPVIMGIMSLFTINIDEWPEIEAPFIAITVVQVGVAPEQLETGVAEKIEEAIAQVPGVTSIVTRIQDGVSLTWAELTMETDVNIAAQNIRDKISAIRQDLPADIEEPMITRYDPLVAFPVISLAVTTTSDLSLVEKTVLTEDLIKEQLESVSGVGAVKMYGDTQREIQIKLDKTKLAAYQLTIPEILAAFNKENIAMPGGKVSTGKQEITLRTCGKLVAVAEFNLLPVAIRDGVQVYVQDIAVVIDGIKEQRTICRFQGQPAIGLEIIKQSGTNTIEVVDRVKAELIQINAKLPPGIQLEVVRDNSITIRQSVNDVAFNLVLGALLATLTIFVFLRNWRSTVIIAIAIPASMIATIFVMRIMDFTLNTMSLMALSMAIGLLIDDAIVVIENIERHFKMGKNRIKAAQEGASEVGMAVLATTLVIIAVFFPVAMMTGMVGQFFKQFGITVIFAISFSLLMALTLVPMLSSRHLKSADTAKTFILIKPLLWFHRQLERITVKYVSLLKAALQRRWITVLAALILFGGSLLLVPQLGSGFIPKTDIGNFTITARLDAGLNLNGAAVVATEIETVILNYPEVIKYYTTATSNEITIFVQLLDKRERERDIDTIISSIRRDLNTIPGVRVAVNQKIGMMESETILFYLQGPDINKMQQYAGQIQKIMESIPGVVDISTSYKPGKPEVNIEIKHQVAADLGVNTAQTAKTLHTLFSGSVVGQFEDGPDRVDVRVRLDESQRQYASDLHGIYLPGSLNLDTQKPVMIPLWQVAQTKFTTETGEITRYNRARDITIQANLEDISLGEFNKTFQERVAQEISFEPGYRIFSGGNTEDMQETFVVMAMAMVTAILFIFLILAAQFESYISPLAIMFALPLAIIGAVGGLYLMNSELSMVSMIGIVFLMGLAAKNGILLIEFVTAQRAKGITRNKALLTAAKIRFRPIMMTASALVMSMLPLALGLGPGAEARAPMAHAVIGGMITATILTLVVVPVMYSLLDDLRNKIQALVSRKQSKELKGEINQ